jgi:poly-gamma-glutamate synthesis protein (capsule biosynthesis protein)
MVAEDKKQLEADVAAARAAGADIVVCSFHWGVSRGHREIVEYQIELAHHAIDCGGDIVFGHHPHVTQGVEVYKGKAIFYSLGNFTFAQHSPAKGHEAETAIVKATIRDRRIIGVEYLPVVCDSKATPFMRDCTSGAEVVDLLTRRSKQFGTEFRVGKTSVEIVLGQDVAVKPRKLAAV